MTKKGFLSSGEHIDDVMMRVIRDIDKVLAAEIGHLTVKEREYIYRDISSIFKDAEAF